ncbi:hypothetical protein AAC387_Pa07g2142 [Persea americana]
MMYAMNYMPDGTKGSHKQGWETWLDDDRESAFPIDKKGKIEYLENVQYQQARKWVLRRMADDRSSAHCSSVPSSTPSGCNSRNRVLIPITFGENGQPIGQEATQLSSLIGRLAKTYVPPIYAAWTDVPSELKEQIWKEVSGTYTIEISSTSAALAASQVGRTARSKMKSPHTTGRKGCARVAAELKAQRPNEPVTRTDVFLATHKRKDGSSSSPEVDVVITARESDRSVVESDIDNDAVAKVFGRDGKGRVLGLGLGVLKTAIQYSTPYKRAL